MTTPPIGQHGLSILHAQIKPAAHRSANQLGGTISPFITVSRETCAGTTTLGKHLLPLLNEHLGDEHRSWMFLD